MLRKLNTPMKAPTLYFLDSVAELPVNRSPSPSQVQRSGEASISKSPPVCHDYDRQRDGRLGLALATALTSLAFLLIQPCATFGQNSNAPVLTISHRGQPEIALHGLNGKNYQVQYNATLNPTNWQVLTNFLLGTSAYSVVDALAPAVGMRLYRGLLLQTNGPANYAPTNLAAGEAFSISWTVGGIANHDALILNSSTTGTLLRQGASPSGGVFSAVVTYSWLGPFLAQITVISPPAYPYPVGQTNVYVLVFAGRSFGDHSG
jgi:hypothetical protein